MEENVLNHSVHSETSKRANAPRHQAIVAAKAHKGLGARFTAAVLALGLVSAGIGTAYAMSLTRAKVVVDGKTQELSSWGNTVADLLKDNDVKVSDQDLVEPGLKTALAQGMTVKIESSRSLTVKVDNQEDTATTTAESVGEAVAKLWPGKAVEFIAVKGKDRNGETLPLFATGQKVQLLADSQDLQVKAKASDSIDDLVAHAKVTLGGLDEAHLTFTPEGDAVVRVVRIKEEQVTVEEDIPFETKTTNDDSKYRDQKTVTQAGQVGTKTVTKKVKSVDGQVVSEEVLKEEVTKQPVEQLQTVGTKERPASSAGEGVWGALAQCESHGNPSTNTGNGFYGMYQFSLPTWRAMGGSGLPSEASAEEQTMRAQILQQRAGWGQWPACARKLGLL